MHRRTLFATPLLLATPALAQGFPNRPIRLIVPFAAGGSTDALSRLAAQILNERLGQSVVVENITGAGGVIGASRVAEAAPDGYTLMGGTPGPVTINPHLMARMPYDPLKDLEAVAFLGDSPAVSVVPKSSSHASLAQVVAAAKARPGGLAYASAGVGSFAHLAGELFRWRAGVDVTHVPYRGTAPAVTDLMANRVELMFENYPSVQPWIASGDLRVLAVGTEKRSTLLPNIPTFIEAGVPNYQASSWFGLFAPARCAPEAVRAINQAINEGLRTPQVLAKLAELGVEPTGGTPQEFASLIAQRHRAMGELVRAAGITPS